MNNTNLTFDARWLNSGGIGRFCQEIMSSSVLSGADIISGDLSSALSAKDPLRLTLRLPKKNYFVSPGYNSPLFSRGRSIITVHDLMHLHFSGYSSLKNNIYYDWVVRRAIRSAPLVFTVSEFTRDEISEWADIPLNKIVVVPNGVDHHCYHEKVIPIERDLPYFIYVGNNKAHKNLVRLLHSFAEAGFMGKADLLLSCSPTPELLRLVKLLEISQNVIFLSGIKEDILPRYYKGAVATIVASLYEGFCLPILESMAVGTPVITSNITAMPRTAGGAALLVDPYSVDSIKNAFLQIWQDEKLRESLIKKGLMRAQDFSWNRSRKIWDSALIKVLEIV